MTVYAFIIITLCNNNTSYNYIPSFHLRSFLVRSSIHLRFISIPSSKYLRYAFAMPPLCLRFVNEGRSSSQRRMIEFTTKDERRNNGEGKREILCLQQTQIEHH